MQDIERQHYLIGDFEREYALEKLKSATESGHLSLAEFDQRAARAASARTKGDIETLVHDIPEDLVVKTERTSGLQRRIGIIALDACLIPFALLIAPELATFVALLIPVLVVLLFVLKVGPDSLYRTKTTYTQIGK
ncbi:DUF1707 domain-containing protein [Corynebacterium sp. H128]|uniref:DUF1707 domain-containing protein n=1 Tax=unclassified Corynebacterium TaxID=2624378 RepID=UPI0030AC73DE